MHTRRVQSYNKVSLVTKRVRIDLAQLARISIVMLQALKRCTSVFSAE